MTESNVSFFGNCFCFSSWILTPSPHPPPPWKISSPQNSFEQIKAHVLFLEFYGNFFIPICLSAMSPKLLMKRLIVVSKTFILSSLVGFCPVLPQLSSLNLLAFLTLPPHSLFCFLFLFLFFFSGGFWSDWVRFRWVLVPLLSLYISFSTYISFRIYRERAMELKLNGVALNRSRNHTEDK